MSDFHDHLAFASSDAAVNAVDTSPCETASPSQPKTERPAFGIAAPRTVPRETARFDLATFATWLPRLGPVLWVDRLACAQSAAAQGVHAAGGVLLLDHPTLSALSRCSAATAHTQVTSHGPREWLCLRGADDAMLAKLFLLPDTDYLAWDEMTTAMCIAPSTEEPARWNAHAAFLRSAFARLGTSCRARLLTFAQRRLAFLQTLDARAPLRISLLGMELARLIARSENAEWISPLHTA